METRIFIYILQTPIVWGFKIRLIFNKACVRVYVYVCVYANASYNSTVRSHTHTFLLKTPMVLDYIISLGILTLLNLNLKKSRHCKHVLQSVGPGRPYRWLLEHRDQDYGAQAWCRFHKTIMPLAA